MKTFISSCWLSISLLWPTVRILFFFFFFNSFIFLASILVYIPLLLLLLFCLFLREFMSLLKSRIILVFVRRFAQFVVFLRVSMSPAGGQGSKIGSPFLASAVCPACSFGLDSVRSRSVTSVHGRWCSATGPCEPDLIWDRANSCNRTRTGQPPEVRVCSCSVCLQPRCQLECAAAWWDVRTGDDALPWTGETATARRSQCSI